MSSRTGRSQQIKHHYGRIYALTAALLLVVAVIVAITAMQLSGLTSRLLKPPSPQLFICDNQLSENGQS